MPELTSVITETDLLERLRNSSIDKAQQKELEAMIPEMTQGDREELIKLIERANAESRMAGTTLATKKPKKKRVLLTIILITIALLLIAVGILYALNILPLV